MPILVPQPPSTEFIVGADSFADLEIHGPAQGGLYYFKNRTKTLVKRFVLKKGPLSQKNCYVTLIQREDGDFEPRFTFEILDLSKNAVQQIDLPVTQGETRTVKAKVNLDDCHDEFSHLLKFIGECEGITLSGQSFAVVSKDEKEQLASLLGDVGKEAAVAEFAKKYAGKISEQELDLLAGRKKSLDTFRKLLTDKDFFEDCRKKLGVNKRPEDVWQAFFERNTWIFGYGLQLVCCEALDGRKLEAIVIGSDVLDGAGKRTDALLKTRGHVSKTLFGEIKTHLTPLMDDYPRPSVFVPGKDLQGAVAQVQKTVHKVSLRLTENFKKITDKDGNPTGEQLAFIRPRCIVVVGRLSEFETEHGLNEEQYASFELYRQGLSGIEILTFDELYERTRFIVEQ